LTWRSWQRRAEVDPAAAAIVKRHIERPAEELYDLAADPHEQRNLAGEAAQAERLASMRAELDAWLVEQGDRLEVFDTPVRIGEPAPPLPTGPARPRGPGAPRQPAGSSARAVQRAGSFFKF
jgi:hypothetical protein